MSTTADEQERPVLADGQQVLDGRLVVRGVIGRGGLGVVYRADDRVLGRQVALKTLSNFDADGIEQLKAGFRTLAGVSHRNLVQLYELGASDQLWFLIMELVEGEELARWVGRRPSMERILHVFGELAEGLRVLHAAGLMHRDVKPANVMVTPSEHAVLLDFGLTFPIRARGLPLAAGTLDYIAPEQLWNESPAASADWFSFGVMLFEALTGTLPFTGPDRLKAMRRGPVCGPRALVPAVPPVIDRLVTSLLAPDPERRPGPIEIARALGAPPPSDAVAPLYGDVPFVGRAALLQELLDRFQHVREGRSQMVHLHGPSGIGKTAAVRHFLGRLRDGEALILEGACHPQESVPYNALDGVLDALGRHLLTLPHRDVLAMAPRQAAALLQVFPVLGRVPGVREWPAGSLDLSPSDVRRHGADALRELLSRLTARQPMIVWIDDIQWSDRDSAVLLKSVVASPDSPPVLLLLSSRDDLSAPALVADLSASLTAVDLPLTGLNERDSRQLALTLANRAGLALDLDATAAEANGSPFLLTELVRYLHAEPGPDDSSGPFTLRNALRSRFERLSLESRRLLEFVALAGKPLDLDLALDVAGLDLAGRLLAYSLCSASWLRITTQDERPRLETYHDRLREFAIENLGREAFRSGHRALADGIAASRSPDTRSVVGHLLQADAHRDAARFAVAAAQEAARDLAFDQAVEMYDVALMHGPNARERGLLERRAEMLAYAGRRAEAARAYEATAEVLEPQSEARAAARVHAAEQFLHGGELKHGLSVMEAVLGEVGIRVPRGPLGRSLRALWHRARFVARGPDFVPRDPTTIEHAMSIRLDALWRISRGMVMLDPALADVLAGEHLLASLRCGDASRAVRALGLEAAIEANIGGRWLRRRSARLLDQADRVAADHGTAYDRAWLTQSRAVSLFFAGQWRQSLALSQTAERLLRAAAVGASWDVAALHGFMLSALANLGDLPQLARMAEQLVQDAERRRDQYALRVFRTGDAVLIWLAADRVELALDLAEDTLIDYGAGQFTSQHRHHMVATVLARLYAGQPAPAWERVERSWPLVRRAGFLLMDCLGTQLRYLRACTAVAMASQSGGSARRRFVRAARHETRQIARSDQPMAAPMARGIESALAGLGGDPTAQRAILAVAADGFDRADMALHASAARWHAAALGREPERDRQPVAEWMVRHGVARADLLARAIVPVP